MRCELENILLGLENGNDMSLVSIAAQHGSSPRGMGATMLVGHVGRISGSVGGGSIEMLCIDRAKALIKEKSDASADFSLKQGENTGMVCGGDVNAWFNYISAKDEHWHNVCSAALEMIKEGRAGWLVLHLDAPPCLIDGKGNTLCGEAPKESIPNASGICALKNGSFFIPLPIKDRAIIFGGGHCAQALVSVLDKIGFAVTVMENRREFTSPALFPDAEKIILGDFDRIDDYICLADYDYVVIMTSGHSHDLSLQKQVLTAPPYYIGVIGSRSKRVFINQKLSEAGFDAAAIARVHSPIGMAIKAVTPEEIAISIAGEMIYCRALLRESRGIVKSGCPMH